MKNHYFFLVILLIQFITFSVAADNNDKAINDSILVDSMRAIQYSNQVMALKIGFDILERADLDKSNQIIGRTYSSIGNIFFDQGFYGLSEEYYAKAMIVYMELQDTIAVAWLHVSMGNLNYKNKLYDDAEKEYKKAMQLFIKINLPWSQATVQNNLALIQLQQNDFSGALLSYKKALKLRRLVGDSGLIAHSYIYIGELYFKQKEIKKSQDYLQKAFNIGLEVQELNIVGRSALLLGECYTYLGDSLLANTYFDFAEKDFYKVFNASYLIDLFQRRAEINIDAGNFNEGKKYLIKALKISESNNMMIKKSIIYEHLLQMSKDKKLVSDTTIQQWQKNLSDVYKELYESEVGRSLSLIEMRNELKKYKTKVDLKESEIRKANTIRNTFILIGLFALLLLFVIYLKYRDNRIKNSIILKQREKYYEQQMDIEQLKTEKIKLKLDVEQRDLVMKAVFIQRKNKLIAGFKKELKYQISLLDSGTTKGFRKLLKTMNSSATVDESLVDFEKHFTVVYPSFFDDLSRKYPQLSAKELKVCAYHKMNMDTKEIANIMSVTVRAVQTSRYRIRQKLNIPKNISLLAFFNA